MIYLDDKNLEKIALYATEKAAIACNNFIGLGNQHAADEAAVTTMREYLNSVEFSGEIVIGEGERDEAPMLYIGEKLGKSRDLYAPIDIAVDPLEGTALCANNMPGSLAVIALSKSGCLLKAPDVYMDKIAVGIDLPSGEIDLDNSPKKNLSNLAKAKKCSISDLRVVVLNRERHLELMAKIKEAGAQLMLIEDGDVAAVISTAFGEKKCDAYMGIGGAPEGVLAAAALRTTGGFIQGRLLFRNEMERAKAFKMGIKDISRKYDILDLAQGDVIFCATGVTSGDLLKGVTLNNNSHITTSLLMNSATKQVRMVESGHIFQKYCSSLD